MKKINDTLLVDEYELKMSQTYFDAGVKDTVVVFDLFFRRNPFKGGYTISGGLDNIIDYILNFKFDTDDIEYLRNTNNYNEEFLEYLSNLKFTGDIYAIPDGTPVFPNEPVITIKAKVIEAQLIETAILAHFNHASLVTTKAKRITTAAQGRTVMEFGARRARGTSSAYEASKYAIVGGCSGTSNVKTAKDLGINALGTMAHSIITFYNDERKAFLNFAKSNPTNCLFLVDTYDTINSGVPNAIWVADNYLKKNNIPFKGIRIDSGDLAYLSKQARKMLDDAGYKDAGICLSNGLDEYTITSLINQGAEFTMLGVGDNIAASLDRVDGVYKLSAIEENGKLIPRLKVSNDSVKTINPGFKKVYRFYDKNTNYALGDVIALADEVIDKNKYLLINPIDEWKRKTIKNYYVRELQEKIFENGKLVYEMPNVFDRAKYCTKEMETIYPEVKRLENPHIYIVDLSEKLLKVKKELIKEHKKID